MAGHGRTNMAKKGEAAGAPRAGEAGATVRVRAIIDRAWHSAGDFRRGEVVEIPRADAEALIACGHAEPADA
jgi:hypothetical protein